MLQIRLHKCEHLDPVTQDNPNNHFLLKTKNFNWNRVCQVGKPSRRKLMLQGKFAYKTVKLRSNLERKKYSLINKFERMT